MSDSGRYMIIDQKTGRKFVVEPIDNHNRSLGWGDIDPASKKLTGSYGEKHKGSITEDESIITEANGFKNIVILPAGTSPESYVENLLKNEK